MLIAICDHFGHLIEQRSYDSLGRLSGHTRLNTAISFYSSACREGTTTSYSYDHRGRLRDSWVNHHNDFLFTYNYFIDILNAAGDSKVRTGIGENCCPYYFTFETFDRYGRRTSAGVEGGDVAHFTHDLRGRVINERSAFVNNTYTHDIFGNVLTITNIEGNTSRFTYDNLGRLIAATDFKGNTSHSYYDAAGRLIKTRTPFERVNGQMQYSITKFFYDQNSNVIRTAVSSGTPGGPEQWRETTAVFDIMNRVTSTTTDNITAHYTYDAAGNVLTMTVGGTGPSGGSTTTYVYDILGRLISVTDALGQTETYAYDIRGRLISKTDRNGTVFTYQYDGFDRLIRETASDGSGRLFVYRYDGQLSAETNGTITVIYHYDNLRRLIRQEETGGIVKTYEYNIAGMRTRYTLSINGVRQINTTYVYDSAGRLARVYENGALKAAYTYDVNGNRNSLTYGNGNVTIYTYNYANLITSVTNRQTNGGAVLSSYAYTYFLDGNQRTRTTTQAVSPPSFTTPQAVS